MVVGGGGVTWGLRRPSAHRRSVSLPPVRIPHKGLATSGEHGFSRCNSIVHALWNERANPVGMCNNATGIV